MEQKVENKEFSNTRRIFVEHVIRLLRIFRIARERFRLNPDTYEQVILTVCGLESSFGQGTSHLKVDACSA